MSWTNNSINNEHKDNNNNIKNSSFLKFNSNNINLNNNDDSFKICLNNIINNNNNNIDNNKIDNSTIKNYSSYDSISSSLNSPESIISNITTDNTSNASSPSNNIPDIENNSNSINNNENINNSLTNNKTQAPLNNNNNNNNNNFNLITSSSLESILKDIPDDQLSEEQLLKIKMIKNEILSLTKSIKNNNNSNNIPPPDEQSFDSDSIDSQFQDDEENYQDDEDDEEIIEEYIKPLIYTDNDLSFEQIKELISIIESTPKLYNKEWALVNQSWYSQWEKGLFSKDYLGPIDNYPLLDITDDSNELLRYDIKENQDFVVVPIEVWKVFKDIYGGSPDIIRKVTDRHDIDFKIPIILFLIKSSDINQCSQITKCHIFQYETFFSLKKRASQLFNLSFSDFDIYNFDGGIATQELYLFLTPKTVKLYNNQMILVHEKRYTFDIPDSAPSNISSLPEVDFKSDPKFLELISNRNIDLSFLSNYNNNNNNNNNSNSDSISNNNSNISNDLSKKEEIPKSRKRINSAFFYMPLYADNFSLSFLNYSFFKSSYTIYDPDTILKSEEYIQFEKMQNDYYSNIDQFKAISFESVKDYDNNNNKEINNEINNNNIINVNNNVNNNKCTTSSSTNNNLSNTDYNNNKNINNNNNNSSDNNIYFHGVDLEEDYHSIKKGHRPPKCKVN